MNQDQLHEFLSEMPTDEEVEAMRSLHGRHPETLDSKELALFMKFYGLIEEIGRERANALIEKTFPK